MAQYICRGSLELNGVIFTINADNIEEARKKARDGQWAEYDIDTAETINAELRIGSLEANG